MKRYEVIVQEWVESVRGWGTSPDGYSLHFSDMDRDAFVTEYWHGLPDGIPPEVYSRPDGTGYWALVGAKTQKMIKDSKNGIRVHLGCGRHGGRIDGGLVVFPTPRG